ncbi:hypothetical protein [Streptomyces sp. NBC_01462]|uniref:hypothetical protein n=1 Tax=Streptomyces sp. NBC_01462 TaxID=2903876 RepID=UPI002E34F897|nr:hypothetical protein [Streptomyces sp. NBC_01462]
MQEVKMELPESLKNVSAAKRVAITLAAAAVVGGALVAPAAAAQGPQKTEAGYCSAVDGCQLHYI